MIAKETTRPLMSVMSHVASDLAYLVQTEFRLARAEIRENVAAISNAGVWVALGGALGLAGVIVLLLDISRWLNVAGMPSEWSLLLVAAATLVGGGVLASVDGGAVHHPQNLCAAASARTAAMGSVAPKKSASDVSHGGGAPASPGALNASSVAPPDAHPVWFICVPFGLGGGAAGRGHWAGRWQPQPQQPQQPQQRQLPVTLLLLLALLTRRRRRLLYRPRYSAAVRPTPP